MHKKLTKCQNFTWYLPEKLTKFPNFKLGLKFIVIAPITLRLVGVTSRNFSTRCAPRRRSVQVGTTFGEGPPPKIWEGKKRLKFGAISDNYPLRSRISPEGIHKSKIVKLINYNTPTLGEKGWWTLVHKQKSYRRKRWPTQVEFRRDYRQLSTLIRQVALLRAAFEPPEIVSAVGLAAPGGLT